MPSLRSRLIYLTFKHRHLLRLQLKRETVDWTTYEAILRFRREVEDGARRFGQLPAGVEATPVTINDMYAEWIMPAQAIKDKVILYFHGGGYVSGTCPAHRSIVAKFVKGSQVGALLYYEEELKMSLLVLENIAKEYRNQYSRLLTRYEALDGYTIETKIKKYFLVLACARKL